MCLGRISLAYPFGVCSASWNSVYIFYKIWEIFSYNFFKYFSASYFLLSPGTLMTWMFYLKKKSSTDPWDSVHFLLVYFHSLLLSHTSQSLFSLWCSDSVIPIIPSSMSPILASVSSILLLNPSVSFSFHLLNYSVLKFQFGFSLSSFYLLKISTCHLFLMYFIIPYWSILWCINGNRGEDTLERPG